MAVGGERLTRPVAGGPGQGAGQGAGPVQAWAAALFPVPLDVPVAGGPVPSAGRGRGRGRGRTGMGYLAGLAALTATALLRQSGVPATRTVWAEDGKIFYSQALSLPFGRTLLVLHDGYTQLFPRLAVQLARLGTPGRAAEVMALAGALSAGILGCLVFHMARGHISSGFLRVVLVAGMVLLPVANVELLDNLVNVPWWLFFATFWALLWVPQTGRGRLGAVLVCFLAGASEPLVALFLPLAVFRWVALRRPRDHAPTAGLVIGLAYQAAVVLHTAGATTHPGRFDGVAQSFATRAGLGLLSGVRGTDWLALHHRDLGVGLGVLVVCAIVAAGLWAGRGGARMFCLTAVGLSVICFVVPVWARAVAGVMQRGKVEVAGRYEAVPLLLLVSAVVVVAGHFSRSLSAVSPGLHMRRPSPAGGVRRWRRSLMAAGVCLILLGPTWVVDFRNANQRSGGPEWSAQVARVEGQCRLAPAGPVSLAIDPGGWTATLPCRALAGH